MLVADRARIAVEIPTAQPRLSAAYFLIANPRLESSVSTSKERRVRISNRKFIAVF